MGKVVSKDDFVSRCLKLQDKGAENINLVTGSHHIPLIADFIEAAKVSGLKITVAWNSSSYESGESLEVLKGLVDIWLPDAVAYTHLTMPTQRIVWMWVVGRTETENK